VIGLTRFGGAEKVNDRPRKIHNWKKPSEMFAELVEANASTA
jgi:IS30 family transposase